MSQKTIEQLVLEFYPGGHILSNDQALWYSQYHHEFLRFMFDAKMFKRSEDGPAVVFLRGNILGPRCLSFKKAPGLPCNTSVIVVNLTFLEFLSQTLISITFRTFKGHGPEAFLRDSMARICQVSWPDKFADYRSAHEFLQRWQEFDDILIDDDALRLVQSISSKIANSLKQEAEDIGGFEPAWVDTISNQYFSIIFHMIFSHEYGHYIASRPDLQGPGFERVSDKARISIGKGVVLNARLLEEVICDYIGFENLLFQQKVFRIADWRIALATTWMEMLSATANFVFRNVLYGSYGALSSRLQFKLQFFRTSLKPEIEHKCLHVGTDLSGLLVYAFFPKAASCQKLLQRAATV